MKWWFDSQQDQVNLSKAYRPTLRSV